MKTAPIALFVYNRPWHTQQTIEALKRNHLAAESDLFIFADGPKRPEHASTVDEVRKYARSVQGFRSVTFAERNENLGLAGSIIRGVTEIVNTYGRVIVLEDDLVTLPHFLTYMNDALVRYQDDEQVMQISGHMFPVELKAETDAIFLPFTTSWGWATWARAWKHFDPQAAGYEQLLKDPKLRRRFDLDGSYPYFDMLAKQMNGKIDSWAIRWYLSVFLRNGLTLFPAKTQVGNIGFDGTGVHCGEQCPKDAHDPDFHASVFPPVRIDEKSRKTIVDFLASSGKPIKKMFISGMIRTLFRGR